MFLGSEAVIALVDASDMLAALSVLQFAGKKVVGSPIFTSLDSWPCPPLLVLLLLVDASTGAIVDAVLLTVATKRCPSSEFLPRLSRMPSSRSSSSELCTIAAATVSDAAQCPLVYPVGQRERQDAGQG